MDPNAGHSRHKELNNICTEQLRNRTQHRKRADRLWEDTGSMAEQTTLMQEDTQKTIKTQKT